MLKLFVKTKTEKFDISPEMTGFISAIKNTDFYNKFVTALYVVKEEPYTLFYTSESDVTNTARRVAGELKDFEEFNFVEIHHLNATDVSDPEVYTVMEV